MRVEALLIDDQAGRQEALSKNLPTVGTVGVMYKAATAGTFDFEEHFERLLATSFHLSGALNDRYRQLWQEFKTSRP